MMVGMTKLSEDFEPYWKQGLSIEAYHSEKNFVSSGGLRHFARSPEHFYEHVLMNRPNESTEAMKFGNLVHMALLEPRRFAENLRVEPEINRRSSKERQKLEDWKLSLPPDAITIRQSDLEVVSRIRQKIEKHKVARGMLQTGDREWSGFAKCPMTGLGLRCRPDFMDRNVGIVMDVKTTTDARREVFNRKVQELDYDLAAWMYLHVASLVEGTNFDQFYWLAVEKTPPFAIALHNAEYFLEFGEFKFKQQIRRLVKCVEKNEWPSYQEEADFIHPTDWYMNKMNAEMELAMNQEVMDGELGP